MGCKVCIKIGLNNTRKFGPLLFRPTKILQKILLLANPSHWKRALHLFPFKLSRVFYAKTHPRPWDWAWRFSLENCGSQPGTCTSLHPSRENSMYLMIQWKFKKVLLGYFYDSKYEMVLLKSKHSLLSNTSHGILIQEIPENSIDWADVKVHSILLLWLTGETDI